MPPKLEHLVTYKATLKPPIDVGAGPYGLRRIFDVTGGSFEGPRMRGKLLPSGGDWMLVGPDGHGRLDVRATFETHDGALIYVSYTGVAEINAKILAALGQGVPSSYGDSYFMTTPRFETGDARYAWLNRVVAVAEGRVIPDAVEYRVYQVSNG